MNAADVMTRAVVTIPPSAALSDALRLMLDQRISGVPVVGHPGRLVGILTEGDLLRRAETGTEKRPWWLDFLVGSGRQAQDYVRSHGRKVEEVMTRDVATVGPDTPLAQIVDVMERRHIKRVPVVEDGRLVGLVSRSDFLRALAQELGKAPPATSDAIIREKIAAELSGQTWSRGSQVTTIVTDGVVYLEGYIFDEAYRPAIRVAAENVAGVGKVQDNLEYIDPNIGLAYGI